MDHSEADALAIRHVLRALPELSETPAAKSLTRLTFGSTNAWEAIRYDLAEQIYVQSFAAENPAAEAETAFIRRIGAGFSERIWRAQVNRAALLPFLNTSGSRLNILLGLVDSMRHRQRNHEHRPPSVLFAGFLNRSGPCDFVDAMAGLNDAGEQPLILRHGNVPNIAARACERQGIGIREAEELFSNRDYFAAARISARIQESLLALAESLSTTERWSRAIRMAAATSLSPAKAQRAILHGIALQKILSRTRPKLVVVPDERLLGGRIAALIAANQGFSTISFPLGDQLIRRMPPFRDLVADKMYVFCNSMRGHMARAGIGKQSFGVIRDAGLTDAMAHTEGRPREELRSMLQLGADTKVVLFASQGFAINRRLIADIHECTARILNAALVVRPHPVEIESWVRRLWPRLHISRDQSALDAITACDVLVTHSSFMAVQASVIGRPVVLYNLDPAPHLSFLTRMKTAICANTKDELQQSLFALLSDDGQSAPEAQAEFRAEVERAAAYPALDAILAAIRPLPVINDTAF